MPTDGDNDITADSGGDPKPSPVPSPDPASDSDLPEERMCPS